MDLYFPEDIQKPWLLSRYFLKPYCVLCLSATINYDGWKRKATLDLFILMLIVPSLIIILYQTN